VLFTIVGVDHGIAILPAIGNIVKARESGPFKDLFDFCRRVDKRIVNRRTVEALIKAGAFDSLNDHRASLMASVDAALASADQQARAANQNSLFGHDEADVALIVKYADVPRWRLREQLAEEAMSLHAGRLEGEVHVGRHLRPQATQPLFLVLGAVMPALGQIHF